MNEETRNQFLKAYNDFQNEQRKTRARAYAFERDIESLPKDSPSIEILQDANNRELAKYRELDELCKSILRLIDKA